MRNALLCVLRRAPRTPFDAELAAADWIQNVCDPGAYSNFSTCGDRTSIYQLGERCQKLANAYLMLRGGRRATPDHDIAAALGRNFANTLCTTRESHTTHIISLHMLTVLFFLPAVEHHQSAVRFLPGDELHLTLHASVVDGDDSLHTLAGREKHRNGTFSTAPRLSLFVQPAPPALTHRDSSLCAELAPPSIVEEAAAAAARDDLERGADGGWATAHVHPTLSASASLRKGIDEALLHDERTDRVIEGLTSNLFVVDGGNVLWTASAAEGAYLGTVRAAVLRLAKASTLFADVVERAPSATGLRDRDWREAFLTCSLRGIAPLSRVWMPNDQEWAELRTPTPGDCGATGALATLLKEEMRRESEPIRSSAMR
jgi:branched-subunit amino acid aminotransferase/4-amino-4-deoxychorismate lyase